MRKRIIVTLITVGLAVSGGAIASAQTDTGKTRDPADKTPKTAPAPDKKEAAPADKPARDSDKPPRDSDKRRAEGQKHPDRRDGKKFGPGVGHAIHGELLVPVRSEDGSDAPRTFETVIFDRGRVVTATDEQLTLERPDGQRVTVALNDDTSFRGVSKGSELKEGSPVFVVAKDGVARHVGQPKPRPEGEKKRQAPGEKPAA